MLFFIILEQLYTKSIKCHIFDLKYIQAAVFDDVMFRSRCRIIQRYMKKLNFSPNNSGLTLYGQASYTRVYTVSQWLPRCKQFLNHFTISRAIKPLLRDGLMTMREADTQRRNRMPRARRPQLILNLYSCSLYERRKT